MKYHINGIQMDGCSRTLIHVEPGDDQLEFLVKLLRRAFFLAKPIGGSIMWSRYFLQEPMSDTEARELIGEIDCGSYLGYMIKAPRYRYRELGIELLELHCTCESDEPVFILNEELFYVVHGQSSESFLRDIGVRPWKNRIKMQEIIEQQREKENFN